MLSGMDSNTDTRGGIDHGGLEMNTFEEAAAYVEKMIRWKARNCTSDIVDDLVGDAMLHLWSMWPRVTLPVPKAYIRKTYAFFVPVAITRYLNPVKIPDYFNNNGIWADNVSDLALAQRLPGLTEPYISAIQRALSYDGVGDPHYVLQHSGDRSPEAASKCPADSIFDYEHVDRNATPDKKAETRDFVKKLLASLSEEEYTLLVEVVVEGETQQKIAKREGVSKQAISQRIIKIIDKIQKEINK